MNLAIGGHCVAKIAALNDSPV